MRAIVTEERRRSRAKGGSPFGASPFWATALPNFLSVFPIRPENSASRRRKIDWPECSLNKGLVSKHKRSTLGDGKDGSFSESDHEN